MGASAGHKSAKDFSEQQPQETRVTLPLTGWAVSGEELPYKVSERGMPGLTAEVSLLAQPCHWMSPIN